MPKGVIVEGEEDLGKQILCAGCSEYYPMDKEFFANKRKPICRACVADGIPAKPRVVVPRKPKPKPKRKRKAKPKKQKVIRVKRERIKTPEQIAASRARHLRSYYRHREERIARMRERKRNNAPEVNRRRREQYAKMKQASATILNAADTSPQQGGGGSETAPAVSTSSE
jgi:hypothetical protein